MRKPFYLHKRGRVWYVQFVLPSGELASAKSSGLTNKTAAEAWARKRASEFAERRTDLSFGEWSAPFFSPDCPHSKRLAEEGRKLSPYSLRVNRGIFERYIKPDEALARVPLADLRRADLLAFRSRLVAARGVCRTAQAAMGLVRIIVREALYQELIDRDPTVGIATIRYEKQRRLALKPEAILAVLRPELFEDRVHYEMSLLAAATGMRAGEVRALRWGDIDFDAGAITVSRAYKGDMDVVGSTKSGKARTCPLPAVVSLVLLPRRGEPEALVFSRARSQVGYQGWARAFAKAAAAGGAPGLTLHGLRHSLNTALRDAGVPDEKIRAWLGWSDPSIQDNYTHRSLYDLSDAAGVVDGLFGG